MFSSVFNTLIDSFDATVVPAWNVLCNVAWYGTPYVFDATYFAAGAFAAGVLAGVGISASVRLVRSNT